MKRTLEELATARREARANLFGAVTEARAQLSPASLSAAAKAMVRSRSREVATASMRQATAHQGVIVGALAAAITLLLVNLFARPDRARSSETRHD